MILAMMYPESENGGWGKKSAARKLEESSSFSYRRLNQAHTILHHSRSFAESVLGNRAASSSILPPFFFTHSATLLKGRPTEWASTGTAAVTWPSVTSRVALMLPISS
jgi:hypothetical protein